MTGDVTAGPLGMPPVTSPPSGVMGRRGENISPEKKIRVGGGGGGGEEEDEDEVKEEEEEETEEEKEEEKCPEPACPPAGSYVQVGQQVSSQLQLLPLPLFFFSRLILKMHLFLLEATEINWAHRNSDN